MDTKFEQDAVFDIIKVFWKSYHVVSDWMSSFCESGLDKTSVGG
jgi:hypothetical protein